MLHPRSHERQRRHQEFFGAIVYREGQGGGKRCPVCKTTNWKIAGYLVNIQSDSADANASNTRTHSHLQILCTFDDFQRCANWNRRKVRAPCGNPPLARPHPI
jgi:hypothetical protein